MYAMYNCTECTIVQNGNKSCKCEIINNKKKKKKKRLIPFFHLCNPDREPEIIF